MSEIIPKSDQEFVDSELSKMIERFDSVQIFVTRHSGEADNTAAYETGGGNFYARLGQISEWLAIQDQYQRQHAVRQDAKAQEGGE